jgi:hypothetical protein
MQIRFKRFLASDWENLEEEFFLQAQALSTSSSSIPFPQHDPPTHKRLFCNVTFGLIREYFQVVCILAPFSPTPKSFDTTSTFTTLHPKLNGYFPLFLKNYKPD